MAGAPGTPDEAVSQPRGCHPPWPEGSFQFQTPSRRRLANEKPAPGDPQRPPQTGRLHAGRSQGERLAPHRQRLVSLPGRQMGSSVDSWRGVRALSGLQVCALFPLVSRKGPLSIHLPQLWFLSFLFEHLKLCKVQYRVTFILFFRDQGENRLIFAKYNNIFSILHLPYSSLDLFIHIIRS